MGIVQKPIQETISPPKTRWQKYSQSGIPEYLAKNYWWAYLSPWGVKIFDHPWMVNLILWGQYHKIARATVERVATIPPGKLAEISCAYGEIIPLMATQSGAQSITLLDIAPIQLNSAAHKLQSVASEHVSLLRANAEKLPMTNNQYDTSLLFFLLHELPATSREKVLNEAIRITKPGGRLLIADYGPLNQHHWFHRPNLFRWTFESLEPFLGNFWRCDLLDELKLAGAHNGKSIHLTFQRYFWHGFYRLWELSVK